MKREAPCTEGAPAGVPAPGPPNTNETLSLSLDDYEAANLREGLLTLRRIGCDTGDWLGQILNRLPETKQVPNQTVEQQVGNIVRYGRLDVTPPSLSAPDPSEPTPETTALAEMREQDDGLGLVLIRYAFRYAPGVHHQLCETKIGKECDCFYRYQEKADAALDRLAERLRDVSAPGPPNTNETLLAVEGSTCTKRDHVVPGGIREPLDTRKYRCACGLVMVSGTGVVEIRFGLLDRLYPGEKFDGRSALHEIVNCLDYHPEVAPSVDKALAVARAALRHCERGEVAS